jgi:hypothetical protein
MHPFSFLPGLFFLSPLAATLLRVAAALVFFHITRYYYEKRTELAHVKVPIVGHGMWIPMMGAIWCGVVGLMLFFGWYTQLAAIGGAIAAAKFLVWKKFMPAYVPLSYISSALLLVICISLIVTGAGAFAFDLPL